MNTGLIIQFILGVFFALYNISLIFLVDYFFHLEKNLLDTAKILFILSAISVLILNPLSIFSSISLGFQKFKLVSFLDLLINISSGITIILLIFMKSNIYFLVIVDFAFKLIINIVLWIYVFRGNNFFKIHIKYFSIKKFK